MSHLRKQWSRELTSKVSRSLGYLHGMRVEKAQAAPVPEIPAFVELQGNVQGLAKLSVEKPLK